MAETLPEVGSPAPGFSLESHTGETVSLSDFAGKANVVLYFYPKSETPGCTLEACGFRDAFDAVRAAGAVVLGISPDPVKKQAKFVENHHLPFPILADTDHAVAEAYGVWKEKSFMGRKYMGVERVTFVIDRQGIVRAVFPKVKIAGHPQEVLAELAKL